MEELPFYSDAVEQNGQKNYQRWRVDFKGREHITIFVNKLVKVDGKLEKQMVEQNFPFAFKDKCISGILDFPDNYPYSLPLFIFNLINGEILQHHNIHISSQICVPHFILGNAYAHLLVLQILQTIMHFFHTPILGNSFNEIFSTKNYDEQYQIQLKQGLYLGILIYDNKFTSKFMQNQFYLIYQNYQ